MTKEEFAQNLDDFLADARARQQFMPRQTHGLSSNVFSTSDFGTLNRAPSSFFGPLGMLGLQALDNVADLGLVRPGYGGVPTPVFNTAVNFRDTGMSSFQQRMADINGNAFSAAYGGAARARQANMAKLFGDNSFLGKIRAQNPNGDIADVIGFAEDMSKNPIGSPIISQLVNAITGYDEGMGQNIAAGRSLDVAGGLLSKGMLGGVENGKYVDLMGDDFQKARGNIGEAIGMGSHAFTFTSLGRKSRRVHGASEELVATIMADAIQSGAIDEQAVRNSLNAAGVNEEGLDNGTAGTSDVLSALGRVNDRITEKTKQQNKDQEKSKELEKQYEGMADKDSQEAKTILRQKEALDQSIKTNKEELTGLTDTAQKLSKAIADGTGDLIESVTNVVDTLKDFYGSPTEAKQALDRLTGGQGSKNKKIADQVRRQMEDIRDNAILAGMSPAQAAQHIESLQGQLMTHGSLLGAGNAFSGAMAMQMADMSMGIARNFNGDQREQQRVMAAMNEYAGAFDQSDAKNFSILLETARMKGSLSEEEYNRIKEQGQNGNGYDFRMAYNELKTRTFGSVREGNRAVRNAQVMADLSNKVSEDPEALARSQEFAQTVISNEMGKINQQAQRDSDKQRAENSLLQQGFKGSEIRDAETKAESNAIEKAVKEIDKDGKLGLQGAYNNYRDSLIAKGMKPEAATRAANQWFNERFIKAAGGPLSDEQKEAIKTQIAEDTQNELSAMGGFRNGDRNGTGNKATDQFLKDIGAIGANGKLSGEAFRQASKGIYDAMVRDAGALGLDAGQIQDRRKEFEAAMKAGDEERAIAILNEDLDKVQGDASKRTTLFAGVQGKGTFRTSDVKQAEAERAESMKFFQNIMQNTTAAGMLRGFRTKDAQYEFAKLLSNVSDFKKVHEITADEEKERRKLLGLEGNEEYEKTFLSQKEQDRLQELYGKESLTEEERTDLKNLQDKQEEGRKSRKKMEEDALKGKNLSDEEKKRLNELQANRGLTDIRARRDEQKAQGESEREGAGAALMKGLTDDDWTEFANKFKAAGVSMEDFHDSLEKLVRFIMGDVLGDKVAGRDGLTVSERDELKELEGKKADELNDDQKKRLEELKKKRKAVPGEGKEGDTSEGKTEGANEGGEKPAGSDETAKDAGGGAAEGETPEETAHKDDTVAEPEAKEETKGGKDAGASDLSAFVSAAKDMVAANSAVLQKVGNLIQILNGNQAFHNAVSETA